MADRTQSAFAWGFLLLLILAPRVGILVLTPLPAATDDELERAAACLAHNGFLGDVYPGCEKPTAHVAPLYPTVLSGLYVAFGEGRGGHIAQSVLSIAIMTVSILLLPKVARVLLATPAPGWLAAVLMAVLPLHLTYVQVQGAWEQHVTFLAVALIILGFDRIQLSRANSYRETLAFGVGLGLCVLLNPQFFLVGLVFLGIQIFQATSRLAAIQRATIVLIVIAIIITPWIIRCHDVVGSWCFVRSNLGLELVIGNNDDATGRTYTTNWDDPTSPFHRMHPYESKEKAEEVNRIGEAAFMAKCQRDANAWIVAHPERFAELTATRFYLFWFPPADMWPTTTMSVADRYLRATLYRLVAFLAGVGLVRLARRDRRRAGIAFALLFGLSAIYTVTHVELRYLFPLHGLMLVLAGEPVLAFAQVAVPRLFPRVADAR